MAKIYKETRKDTIQAIAHFRDIIVKYPNDLQVYSEASDSPDYIAASGIIELVGSDPKGLMKQSEFILSNSEKPVTRLIGYLGKIKGHRLRGNSDEMFEIASLAIKQHPKGWRIVSESTSVHYPSAILLSIYETLKTQDDVRKFSTLCDTVQTQYAKLEVGTFAALMSAELAFQTNSDVETNISRYQNVRDNFNDDVMFRLEIKHRGIATWALVEARLSSLTNINVTHGTIGFPDTELKIGSNYEFQTIRTLPRGTELKILYPHQALFSYGPDSMFDDYSKVKLENGQIGWVFSYRINET